MVYISRSVFVLSLILSFSYADHNTSSDYESSYIDDLHHSLSHTVMDWADISDNTLSGWLEDDEKNTTQQVDKVTDLPEETLQEEVNYVDSFFQTGKYLDETDNTYILLRTDSFFQSKESADFALKLRAQMPFRKSRRNLKIFIEDVSTDNANNILQDKENSPSRAV